MAAEANTYLQTIIRRVHRTGEPLQIVFLDAKSAFDLTSTEATMKMMRHLGTPEELITKLNNLTNNRNFRLRCSRNPRLILSGTGQGCAASSLKFDITHEGNGLIYTQTDFTWLLKIDDERVDPAVFADNSSLPVQLRSVEDYKALLSFFDSLSEITGFSINRAKTEILASNTPRELIEDKNNFHRGKVVTQVQHLGIILTSEDHRLEQANYEFLQPRLDAAMKKVMLRNHWTYTRALLAESILHSQVNHTLEQEK